MFKLAVKTDRKRASTLYQSNRCAGLLQTHFRSNTFDRVTLFGVLFLPITAILVGCPAISTNSSLSGDRDPSDISADGSETPTVSATESLIERIDSTLQTNLDRRLLSVDNQGAWQILHGILAYGREFPIQTSEGKVIAIDYLLRGGPINGFELRSGDRFEPVGPVNSPADEALMTRGIRTELDPGSKRGQGHRDQWVAYMASCELPAEQVFQTLDGPRRLDLWIKQIEWNVPLNFEREYSWTLMSLIPYRETTHRWKAREGQDYSIESLLRSEIDQLSPDSSCGGSHRLVSIATTLKKRKAEGKPITGVWEDADTLIEAAIAQSLEFQNADGTFSNNYFERSGWSLDLGTAINTTGHTLELIAVGAPDAIIADEAVMIAVAKLCRLLDQTKELDLECGGLYHAISGLQIYRKRLAAIASS
jgi:hypothetical protein